MGDFLFERDDIRYIPSELTRGPWDPHAQHGGPPAALLARGIAAHEDGERMFVARLTVELLRPVPLAALDLHTRWERPGRRIQLVGASLVADGAEVARATGLRIRCDEVPLPALPPDGLKPPPPVAEGRAPTVSWVDFGGLPTFASHGVEHRLVAGGGFGEPGPATDWIRLSCSLVAGEPTSPLCRTVAAADFGNGISSVLPRAEGYLFINPDLTLYLHRDPIGEWICLDARTHAGSAGIGLAESRLWDEQGPVGRSLQALLIDCRA